MDPVANTVLATPPACDDGASSPSSPSSMAVDESASQGSTLDTTGEPKPAHSEVDPYFLFDSREQLLAAALEDFELFDFGAAMSLVVIDKDKGTIDASPSAMVGAVVRFAEDGKACGLFAARPLKTGEAVAVWAGELCAAPSVFLSRLDLSIASDRIIRGFETPRTEAGCAQFVRDMGLPVGEVMLASTNYSLEASMVSRNVGFALAKREPRRARVNLPILMALRDIHEGEELFATFGPEHFWNRPILVPAMLAVPRRLTVSTVSAENGDVALDRASTIKARLQRKLLERKPDSKLNTEALLLQKHTEKKKNKAGKKQNGAETSGSAEHSKVQLIDVVKLLSNGHKVDADPAFFTEPFVEVRPSSIPGAGLGVFATRDIAEGEVVCVYAGRTINGTWDIQGENETSESRTEMDLIVCHGITIRGERDRSAVHVHGCAQFINDCAMVLESSGHGVVEYERESTKGSNVCTVEASAGWVLPVYTATRAISAGEELFVSYGSMYWLYQRGLAEEEVMEIIENVSPGSIRLMFSKCGREIPPAIAGLMRS